MFIMLVSGLFFGFLSGSIFVVFLWIDYQISIPVILYKTFNLGAPKLKWELNFGCENYICSYTYLNLKLFFNNKEILDKNFRKLDYNLVLRHDISEFMLSPIEFAYAFKTFAGSKKLKMSDLFSNKYYRFCHNVLSSIDESFSINRKLHKSGIYGEVD